jgi:hypothetical protein
MLAGFRRLPLILRHLTTLENENDEREC